MASHGPAEQVASPRLGNRLLFAAFLLLTLVVWFEPAGSWLSEPDETRYAEIPREMLSTGDFVTPHLNAVPYLEKPPLLYWANTVSFRMFGESPWAARLPARLAALGTTLLLLFAVGRLWGARSGLVAAIFYLATPLGFGLSRLNVTDGMLTFFFTATIFAGCATIVRREAGKNALLLSALTGLAAAGGMLTKGPVALVLPGSILLLWSLATRRIRYLGPLLLGPAVPVFLLLVVPWFFLMERRNPGFLQFFFVHEHLTRFSTSTHHREGPITYFLPVLVAGFLPGLPFLGSALKDSAGWVRRRREHGEELLFLIWVSVVFVFFSLSGSKLVPYVLPAWPALAALAARGVVGTSAAPGRHPAAWWIHAASVTLLVLAISFHPAVSAWIADYELLPAALFAAATLLTTAWLAPLLRRRFELALALLVGGWAALYISLCVTWPKVPTAVAVHELAQAAKEIASRERATIVSYRDLLRGLPWELKSPVPIIDYGNGEIRPKLKALRGAGENVFWKGEKFWKEWRSDRRFLAIVREKDLDDFESSGPLPRILSRGHRRVLLANFPATPPLEQSAMTSVALHNRQAEQEPGNRVRLADLPARVLARAKRESSGERVVRAVQKLENGRTIYELITGGRKPRVIAVSSSGDLGYLEEQVPIEGLPDPVFEGLSRILPAFEIELVTREWQRDVGPDVLYKVYVRSGGRQHEISFEVSGRSYRREVLSSYPPPDAPGRPG